MIELHETPDGTNLTVRVVPRSGRTGIDRVEQGALRVRIAAAPVDGAANQALTDYLAGILGRPKRDIQIVTGARARRKVVRVRGMSAADVEARLRAAL